jgi:hypothetical protein
VDLNQLYFDHQILLMKAHKAPSPGGRRGFEAAASCVAGRIGSVQGTLGAAAAPAWRALAALDQCRAFAPTAQAL